MPCVHQLRAFLTGVARECRTFWFTRPFDHCPRYIAQTFDCRSARPKCKIGHGVTKTRAHRKPNGIVSFRHSVTVRSQSFSIVHQPVVPHIQRLGLKTRSRFIVIAHHQLDISGHFDRAAQLPRPLRHHLFFPGPVSGKPGRAEVNRPSHDATHSANHHGRANARHAPAKTMVGGIALTAVSKIGGGVIPMAASGHKPWPQRDDPHPQSSSCPGRLIGSEIDDNLAEMLPDLVDGNASARMASGKAGRSSQLEAIGLDRAIMSICCAAAAPRLAALHAQVLRINKQSARVANRSNSDQGDMTADSASPSSTGRASGGRRFHDATTPLPRSVRALSAPGFDFLIVDQMIRAESFSRSSCHWMKKSRSPLRQPPWQIASARIETAPVPAPARITRFNAAI